MNKIETDGRLVETLLAETREELVRADGKASLLLAADGVIIGAVVTGIVSTSVSPFELVPAVQWMFWVGATAWIAGIVALGVAVWPNVGNGVTGRLDYFADVCLYENADELIAALEAVRDTPMARSTRQLHALSRLVARKYWAIRTGMILTSTGASLCLLAWAVDAAL